MEKNIFNLKYYKDYLTNYYRWNCDISEEKMLERKDFIDKHYTDDYFKKIINNTQKFSIKLLKTLAKENNIWKGQIYTAIKLSPRNVYIFNNCHGGWHADYLFFENYKKQPISLYLLQEYLGDKFYINLEDDVIENYNDKEEAGSEELVHIIINVSVPLESFRKLYDANSSIHNEQGICQKQ